MWAKTEISRTLRTTKVARSPIPTRRHSERNDVSSNYFFFAL